MKHYVFDVNACEGCGDLPEFPKQCARCENLRSAVDIILKVEAYKIEMHEKLAQLAMNLGCAVTKDVSEILASRVSDRLRHGDIQASLNRFWRLDEDKKDG